jgi:pantetheine-phosphate adenylyltransferase
MKFENKRAIYPGSFDPITNGHLDILDRSLNFFSEITMVVASSSIKNPLLSPEERVQLIRQVTSQRKRVKVDQWSGLMMQYALDHDVSAVIRGLRAASDFEYEFLMASMNRELNPNVETLFMMTTKNLYFVSSSMVKEIFNYGGDITPYVPEGTVEWLKQKKRQ